MKRIHSLYIVAAAFVLLSFTSCERNADVDLPEVKPKLALSCFISPQDTIVRAYVTQSIPIFSLGSSSQPHQPVNNATVTLSDANGSAQLTYNPVNGHYEIPATSFPIQAGQSYRITVQLQGFPTLEATTNVPVAVPSDFSVNPQITVDTTSFPGFPIFEAELEHQFTDLTGTGNYYMVNTVFNWTDTLMGIDQQLDLARVLYNDSDRDGELIRGRQSVGVNIQGSMNNVGIWLTASNYDYYEFHRTLLSGNNGGDPFSEPTLVYSNVTNGFGIFAGCNTTRIIIPL
ncbi:MAG: DUF4249 domain-containing protein [Bacteroidia bacterium]|jgi:hypothetical protein|nr:DUF4249 domain-containing protein [Bacteroidia bacterium]